MGASTCPLAALRSVLCASRPSAEARRLAKSAARDEEWERGLASLVEFADAAGHCDAPYKHCDARGFKLWEWLRSQRVAREKGTLPAARAARLAAVDARWFESPETAAADDREWDRHLNLLREFAEITGRANPTKYETVWTVRVGLWLHRQRLARRKGELPAGKIAQLEALGVGWETIDWATGIALLEEFAAREGHADGRAATSSTTCPRPLAPESAQSAPSGRPRRFPRCRLSPAACHCDGDSRTRPSPSLPAGSSDRKTVAHP